MTLPPSFTLGVTGDKGSRYRLPRLTDEQVLRLCARAKGYHVGVRYRDDPARAQVRRFILWGFATPKRGPRYGDGTTYQITPLGRDTLAAIQGAKP